MSWTQPICVKCWNEQGRGRQVLEDPGMDHPTEVCCFCGEPAGRIYIRVDPTTVPYPATTRGAIARAEALAAGHPDWAEITQWPVRSSENEGGAEQTD